MRWDLSPLFGSADDARAALATSLERATAFEQTWRGAMPEMTGPRLAEALLELGEIDNLLSRVHSYASLRKAVDVTNEENRDLSAAVEQGVVQVLNALRFFELEWLALEDDRAAELAAAPEVAADRHYLEALRRFRPHTLSEPEERVLAERDPAAVSAWQTLFGQTTSTIEVPFDGGDGEEPHTVDRLLAYVHDPRRDVRRGALETLYAALGPHTPVLAQCYDSLVGDRLVLDRLRSYETPITLTHLRNELDASVVDAMLDAVEANYPIAQRWFRAKAGVLGLDKLELHDQYAPVGNARDVGYDEARSIVTTAFDGFAPRVRQVADDLFAEHRIDAEPRAGKRGGAFCSPVAGDADPYIMMNFTDHMNDVLTMAHELGHGMHFELAHAEQTPHSAHTGLALAEVPSTFAEFVTYDHLLAGETDAGTRLALVAARAEGAFATVFRQTVMVRYEQRAYEMRGPADHAHARPALGGVAGGEPALLRRLAGADRRLRARLELHPPLHQHPLLHVRLRVREAGRAGALRALPRGLRRFRARIPRAAVGGRIRRPGDPARTLRRGHHRPVRVEHRLRRARPDGRGGRGRDLASPPGTG